MKQFFLKKKESIQHQGRSLSLVFAIGLALVGTSLVGTGLASQQSLPSPPSSAVSQGAAEPATGESGMTGMFAPFARSLSRSAPVTLEIESIGVRSELGQVGNNPDGTIEVPSGDNYDNAAWYRHGASPGEKGSTVILGHVDSIEKGPSVFFRLGDMRQGELVNLKRADNTRVSYKVTKVAEYPKDKFPTEEVYNVKDGSVLRLVTCGGAYDEALGEYDSNIIVFASLHTVGG